MEFHQTKRILKIHRYVISAVAIFVAIGASASAIRIGNAPIPGPIVVIIIMALSWGILMWQNKVVLKQLEDQNPLGWFAALIWALTLSLFLVGIPAVRELLSKEVRNHFF